MNENFIIQENGYYGIINLDNGKVLDSVYNKIKELSSNLYEVEKNNITSIINLENNKEVINFTEDVAIKLKNNLIYVYFISKNLVRVYDTEGNKIFKNDYKEIIYTEETIFLVCSMNDKYGIINLNEEALIPLDYNDIEFLDDRCFLLNKNGEKFLTNLDKTYKLPNNFTFLFEFINLELGFAFINVGYTNCRIFDLIKQEFITEEFDSFVTDNKDHILLIKEDKKGIFSCKRNKVIIPLEYDEIYDSNNSSLIVAKKSNLYGVINKNNEIIIPFNYTHSIHIVDDIILIRDNSTFLSAVLNQDGKQITPFKYSYVTNFTNDYIKVRADSFSSTYKYGVIDKNGNEIKDMVYNYIYNNVNNYAIFNKNKKYGLFDSNLNEVLNDYDKLSNLEYPSDTLIIQYEKNNDYGIIIEEDDSLQKYSFFNATKILRIGSRNDRLLIIKTKYNYIIKTGCFLGTLECFEKRVRKFHANDIFGQQYMKIINKIKSGLI